MKVLTESGVLPASERYFSTPSATAKKLFFYVTRCGHYYCSTAYHFSHQCQIGQEESHRNFLLFYLRAGMLQFETDQESMSGSCGQCALIDCRKPHQFYAIENSEQLWIHFDGANAHAFFDAIIAQYGGKFVFTPPAGSRIEREMANLIAQIGTENRISEAEASQRLYAILCDLLYPPIRTYEDTSITQAMQFMQQHLFEPISVARIAAAVHLSPSHFSRQFRAQTGFSPHEYIILHRIDAAKALLQSTQLSIKEIAFQTGYRSEVNFIVSFTEKVGVSPKAFRRNAL